MSMPVKWISGWPQSGTAGDFEDTARRLASKCSAVSTGKGYANDGSKGERHRTNLSRLKEPPTKDCREMTARCVPHSKRYKRARRHPDATSDAGEVRSRGSMGDAVSCEEHGLRGGGGELFDDGWRDGMREESAGLAFEKKDEEEEDGVGGAAAAVVWWYTNRRVAVAVFGLVDSMRERMGGTGAKLVYMYWDIASSGGAADFWGPWAWDPLGQSGPLFVSWILMTTMRPNSQGAEGWRGVVWGSANCRDETFWEWEQESGYSVGGRRRRGLAADSAAACLLSWFGSIPVSMMVDVMYLGCVSCICPEAEGNGGGGGGGGGGRNQEGYVFNRHVLTERSVFSRAKKPRRIQHTIHRLFPYGYTTRTLSFSLSLSPMTLSRSMLPDADVLPRGWGQLSWARYTPTPGRGEAQGNWKMRENGKMEQEEEERGTKEQVGFSSAVPTSPRTK
ncbi:hypothetical protein CCUS01_16438 [Colletotrichum cuscutae]|uniref:Uncharacterized protein n=1 Tax=Colletotrichum cuscutae TaxID=1209917 RepID=A0AAI9V9N3_9PEZI|nr:hypothetical protein CCUS01_16438 [Colletotrichum cuscutae]